MFVSNFKSLIFCLKFINFIYLTKRTIGSLNNAAESVSQGQWNSNRDIA